MNEVEVNSHLRQFNGNMTQLTYYITPILHDKM